MVKRKVTQLKRITLYRNNTYHTLINYRGQQPGSNWRSLRNTTALLASALGLESGREGLGVGKIRRWGLQSCGNCLFALGVNVLLFKKIHTAFNFIILFSVTFAWHHGEIYLWLDNMFYEDPRLVYLFRVSLIYWLPKAFKGHEMHLKVSIGQLVWGLRNAEEICNLPSGWIVGTYILS